ncbi:MAG: hypothetical protein J6E31_04990, partial [Pyramidobacter sp.]|nr:hypothetical protein [Pyramidobacter sp.]
FISADKDYRSVIDDRAFNLFLKEEWQKKKRSNIHFFVSLVEFLKAHAKEIELQTEQKKDELINGLKKSYNFQTTHAVIRALGEFHDWSTQQIDDLCKAAIDNSQVLWILGDDDVLSFYKKLLSSTTAKSECIDELKSRISEFDQSEEEDSVEPSF